MNKLQSVKFDKFFSNQSQTLKEVASAISKLNGALPAAIEHQAYAIKNTDNNMDDSIKDSISRRVTELETQFINVAGMIKDIGATKNGMMSVDELIAKYNVNLVQYSNDLE